MFAVEINVFKLKKHRPNCLLLFWIAFMILDVAVNMKYRNAIYYVNTFW